MSLLEERVLKIIELWNSGKDTPEIAAELQLEPSEIRRDELIAKEKIMRARLESPVELMQELQRRPALIRYVREKIEEPLIFTREKRYELIQTALDNGVYNLDALQEGINLSKSTLYKYKCETGIDITQILHNNLLARILELKIGGMDIEDIAEETHTGTKTVKRYLVEKGIIKARRFKRVSAEEDLEFLMLAKKGKSPSQIEEITKRSQPTIRKHLEKIGARPPHKKRHWKLVDKEKRNSLIIQGLPLEEIADLEGVSKQAIDQYLSRSGQRNAWKQKRYELTQRNPAIKEFLTVLYSRTRQIPPTDWALARTQEYIWAHKRSPIDKTYKVYAEYRQAKDKGEKPSYRQIAKKTGCHLMYVMDLFHFAGLKPLCREYHESEIPTKTMMKISRMGITIPDIAYFCGMSDNGVKLRLYEAGFRPKPRDVKTSTGMRKLTYRLASEIYEAKDLKFSDDDISELLDIDRKVVEYAIRKKREIAPTITDALRLIYPKCKKPYKSK